MTILKRCLPLLCVVLLVAGCGGASSSPSGSSGGAPSADAGPTFTPVKILPTETPVPPPPTRAPTQTSVPTSSATETAGVPETEEKTTNEEDESVDEIVVESEAELPSEAENAGEAPSSTDDDSIESDTTPQPEQESETAEESNMVAIPAGDFPMGSDKGDESPVHIVSVDAFEIDIYEVTNAQFARFIEDTGYETDAEKSGDPNSWQSYFTEGKENHPVVKVSWNDGQAYCEWQGKRLPTEAEWEKAARGTEELIYPWGDEWDSARVNSKESGFRGPVAVGSLPDGASPYGVQDMAGNVWEWTDDWYQGYPQTMATSNYFGETYKVLRGGGWFSDQSQVRTTQRNANSADAANDDVGFRCAR